MARTRTTRTGNGAGWGGPAKGVDPNRKPKQDFTVNTNAEGHSKATPAPLNRRAMREDQAEQVKDMLYGLALGAESESAKVQACTAFLNRVEGMPTVKQDINLNVPLRERSEQELDAIIERGAALLGSGSGEEAPSED